MEQEVRHGEKAVYHLRRWLGTFGYLDAVMFDIPIFDEQAAAKISQHLESFDIQDRLERTTAFRNYLTEAWDASGLSTSYLDWRAVAKEGQPQFDAVKGAVEGIKKKQASQQRWQDRNITRKRGPLVQGTRVDLTRR